MDIKSNKKEGALVFIEKFPKFPYNGKEGHLIDNFIIVGYDKLSYKKQIERNNEIYQEINENLIKVLYEESERQSTEEQKLVSVQLKEPPQIMSFISSDYEKETLDENFIISLIFPNKPKAFYAKTIPHYTRLDKKLRPKFTNVVFSSNPVLSDNTKKSYNGYAYIFYESYEFSHFSKETETKKEWLWIPKAFCIISEYPYISAFRSLCIIIRKLFKTKNLTIPIEIILYHLINFTPSPLNYPIEINVSSILPPKIRENILIKYQEEKLNNIWNNNISFPIISGYPLIQFNLFKLFEYIPLKILFQVFIMTFLEKDILVFSENLEYLSIFIFSIVNFGYPLNEGNYYWIVGCISFEEFKIADSVFAKRSYPSIYGINSHFTPSCVDECEMNDYFVLDLDAMKFKYYCSNTKAFKAMKSFKKFVKRKFKDKTNKTFLVQNLKNLNSDLEKIYPKVNKAINNNIDFSNLYENVDLENNKIVQNAFYEFSFGILSYIYKYLSLHSVHDTYLNAEEHNCDNEVFYIEYNKDASSKVHQEEEFFMTQFEETIKFKTYIYTYLQNNCPVDLYRIPLFFFDEFCSFFSERQYKKKPDYKFLNAIEKIYQTTDEKFKGLSLSAFLFKRQNIYNRDSLIKAFKIDFDSIYSFYNDNSLKEKFYKEIIDPKNDITNIKVIYSSSNYFDFDNSKDSIKSIEFEETHIQYTSLVLNNKILFIYNYLMQNLIDPQYDMIKDAIARLKKNIPKEISLSYLERKMATHYIEMQLITIREIIEYDIFLIFCLTRPFCVKTELREHIVIFCEFLQEKKPCEYRKYFGDLLQILAFLSKSENPEVKNESLFCFVIIVNMIRRKVVPSKKMQNLIRTVTQKSKSNEVSFDSQHSETLEKIEISEESDEDITEEGVKITIENNILGNSLKDKKIINLIKEKKNITKKGFLNVQGRFEFPKAQRMTLTNKSQNIEPMVKIVFNYQNNAMLKDIKSSIYTPFTVFEELNEMLDKYTEEFDIGKLSKEKLVKFAVNLIFFVLNMEEFKNFTGIFICLLVKMIIMLKRE